MPIHPIPIWRLQLIPMGWSTAFANASPTCHLGGPGETLPMGWPPTAPWCGGTLPECWEMVAGNIKQLVLNMVFAQNCYGYSFGNKKAVSSGKENEIRWNQWPTLLQMAPLWCWHVFLFACLGGRQLLTGSLRSKRKSNEEIGRNMGKKNMKKPPLQSFQTREKWRKTCNLSLSPRNSSGTIGRNQSGKPWKTRHHLTIPFPSGAPSSRKGLAIQDHPSIHPKSLWWNYCGMVGDHDHWTMRSFPRCLFRILRQVSLSSGGQKTPRPQRRSSAVHASNPETIRNDPRSQRTPKTCCRTRT